MDGFHEQKCTLEEEEREHANANALTATGFELNDQATRQQIPYHAIRYYRSCLTDGKPVNHYNFCVHLLCDNFWFIVSA